VNRRRLLQALPALALCGRTQAAVPSWSTSVPQLPDVALLDHRGESHRLQPLLAAGPVAVNFFYTGCASFCPPQTAIFRQLQGLLDAPPRLKGMLLSISIDPLSDTPAELARYAARFEVRLGLREQWLMLTGSLAQIDAVLAGFGLHAAAMGDHPTQTWVGNVARARWTRTLGLASADELARWMRASAA
jgi:protein SCO1/2